MLDGLARGFGRVAWEGSVLKYILVLQVMATECVIVQDKKTYH